MKIVIHVKQVGKRRDIIAEKPIQLDPVPETAAALIASVVLLQIQEYRQRTERSELLSYLTDEQIEFQAVTGKIAFGISYNELSPDTGKAVYNALQSFEDGIFRLFIDGKEIVSLDEKVCLREGSRLLFVRLTLLAGRMW